MIRARLVETALPAGSRDPQVLISWILDSLGLVRSRGCLLYTSDAADDC